MRVDQDLHIPIHSLALATLAASPTSFVVRIDGLEGARGDGSAGEIGHEENPDVGDGGEAHHGDPDGDRRIKDASRNVADRISSAQNGKADGQSIERVSTGSFG